MDECSVVGCALCFEEALLPLDPPPVSVEAVLLEKFITRIVLLPILNQVEHVRRNTLLENPFLKPRQGTIDPR